MFHGLFGGMLGILFGIRHALEPDHLAAVSTLIIGKRNPVSGALVGGLWGAGHSATLLGVGVTLSFLQVRMTPEIGEAFEFGVAVMLIVLGARAIWRAVQQAKVGPVLLHMHNDVVHRHAGPPQHVHIGHWTFASTPFLVGAIHGLAGSGSLTALVLANLPSTAAQLGYIVLFGLGSLIGMASLSGLAGLPLSRLGKNPKATRAISLAAGGVSVVLGLAWSYPLASRVFRI